MAKKNPFSVLEDLLGAEQDIADFIAGPTPGNALGSAVQQSYRSACRNFTQAPAWAKALAPTTAGSLGRICKPYLDSLGFSLPQPGTPPFTGGQCSNLQYIVFARRIRTQGPGSTPPPPTTCIDDGVLQITPVLQGPIRDVRPVETFTDGNGFVSDRWSVSYGPGLEFNVGSFFRGCPSAGFRNISVQVFGGGPDNCGNPKAPPLQPGPNPDPNPPPIGPGDEPVDSPKTPWPRIPIPDFYDDPVSGPNTPVPEPPEDDSGIPSGGEPIGDEAGPAAPIQGNGGQPSEGEGEDVNFPAPPEGFEYVGAYLKCTFPSEYGLIPGTAPNQVSPRVVGECSLKFGDQRSTSKPVRSVWTDMFRSNPNQKVTGMFVRVLPGITYSVIPFMVETCPEPICGEE